MKPIEKGGDSSESGDMKDSMAENFARLPAH
jgi:hypothetical protein